MAKKFLTPIDLSGLELQNAVIQPISGNKAITKVGAIHTDISINRLRVGVDIIPANDEVIPFVGSGSPTAETVGATTSAGTSNYAARLDHRHAMPGVVTTSVDGFMSATDKTKLDNATSANTASRLVIRDAAGRAQFNDPSANMDAVTLQYLQNYVSGNQNASARVATTGNITTLAGGAPLVVDGITLVANDIILVKNQTNQAQNGLYIAQSIGTGSNGTWVRPDEYDIWTEICSTSVFVEEGTTYERTLWMPTSSRTGTINITDVTYVQLQSAMSTLPGDGLSTNGNIMNVNVDDVTIEINTDILRVKDAGISTAKIADSAVTSDKIASDAVTTAKVLDANVTTAKIADLNITTGKLATNSVTTVKITDANVTTDKLATNAVTTVKILDANVTGDKLAANSVSTTKILDANVTTAKIADLNVTTGKLENLAVTDAKLNTSAVTTVKILDDAVTNAKLADMAANTIKGAVVAGSPVDLTPAQVRAIIASDDAHLSIVRKFSALVGDGSATSFVITHNLNTRDVVLSLYLVTNPYDHREPDFESTSVNSVTLRFAVAPTVEMYRVVIVG